MEIESSDATMTNPGERGLSIRLEGKFKAIIFCWVLGLGSLVAWNSMLIIVDYYYEIFPRYHPSRVLPVVYLPFATGTMAILLYYESKIDTRKRNIVGYTLFTLGTLSLIVLDLTTSGKGGVGPYIVICVLVACFGVANALVQGGMVGDLSLMCPEFIQSYFAGSAASGALTSALSLITKAAYDKSHDGLRKGAILFLAISTFFELICIILYAIWFPKIPVVKYWRFKAASEGSKTVSTDLAVAGIQRQDVDSGDYRLSNKQLAFQNIDYFIDLYLIHVLTLTIMPGFLYENTGKHQLGSWYPLVLVALFNVWDFISQYIPLIIKLESRKSLMLATLSRFLLVPSFYFTAKFGDQGWMMLLISFLGLSHGYLTVTVMTIAPKGFKGPEQNTLGNMLVLFLFGGTFSGLALGWLWILGNDKF